MRAFLISIFILAFVLPRLSAQDTLYMMTGRMITNVEVMRMDSENVVFLREGDKKVNSQGRIKPSVKKRENVFEIRYSDGTSELAYLQDSAGYVLTPEQMRQYVNGCHDAFEYSHDLFTGPGCFAITLVSFMFLPPVAVVAVPSAYSAVMAVFTPQFPSENVDESKINKYYIMGYQDTRKIKKVKSAAFFGVAALATGFILYFATRD